jgi:hypothetical protein
MIEESEEQPSPDSEQPAAKSGRRWLFAVLARNGVRYTLLLTLAIFTVYTAGSMPDPGFPDRILFLLLRLLQYSSLLLCAFSLLAMGIRIRRLVYYPSLRNGIGLLLYFLAGILGAGLAMLNSLIVAVSGGHG